jgi:hypothetical protein
LEEKESFQQQVFLMMKEVLGEKNTIAVPRLFCKAMGDLSGGVFLSQLIYWCDKGSRKDGFIYKTAKEWTEETFLSSYEISKARKKLEAEGILETKLKKANGNPTIHYKLLQKPFVDWLFKFFIKESEIIDNGKLNIEESLTKTTSKITTNITEYNRLLFAEQQRCDINNGSVKEALEYYFRKYKSIHGEEHYKMTIEEQKISYIKIRELITTGFTDPHTDEETVLSDYGMTFIIDKHFGRKQSSKYHHILSFLSDENIRILIECFVAEEYPRQLSL